MTVLKKSSASEKGSAKIVLARIFADPFSLRERPFMSKSSCVSSGECRRHDFPYGILRNANGAG